MRRIAYEDFGRGLDGGLINDIRMTLVKIREQERSEPTILHITLSPERMAELLRNPDVHRFSEREVDGTTLLGYPVYLDTDLGEPGYRITWLR